MIAAGWTMDIPDPDEWTSFAVDPEGGSHSAFTSYNNPEVIALNKQARGGDRRRPSGPRPVQQLQKHGSPRTPSGLPLLLAVRLRDDRQGAGLLRHAARQLPPRGRLQAE